MFPVVFLQFFECYWLLCFPEASVFHTIAEMGTNFIGEKSESTPLPQNLNQDKSKASQNNSSMMVNRRGISRTGVTCGFEWTMNWEL